MKTWLVYPLVGSAALGALAHGGHDGGDWGDWRGGDGQWDGFGPSCASSCLSSYWTSATPTPTALCSASHDLASCVSKACPSATSAVERYSSRLLSACARLTSCTDSGTYTYTYGPGWRWDDDDDRRGSRSGETTVTVTGCPWDGGPWGFWGDGEHYGDGWGNWGSGWKYATRTETVTVTESNGGRVTQSPVVVGQAVSGTETRLTTFTEAAASTTPASTTDAGNNTAPSLGGLAGVKAMGACLAVALLLIALL